MRLLKVGPLFAALLFTLCAASRAAVLVDNPPDQAWGTNMTFSLVADNFSLAGPDSYDISNIRFWSIQSSAADYTGSVYWAIYNDAGGTPGAVQVSGTASPAATATGNSTGFDYGEYVFDIAVNFGLAPGNYWLGLQNGFLGNSDFSLEMLWETTAGGTAPASQYKDFSGDPSSWVDSGNEQAFQIIGQVRQTPPPGTIPEPSTLALLLGGLWAVRAGRRTRASC